jgi:hypothetical protein
MDNPTGGKKSSRHMIWVVGLVVLFAVFAFMFARPLGETESDPAAKPAPQSTEWAEEPKGPAVPVTLPTTPMKMEPVVKEGQAGEGEDAKERE